MDSTKKQLSCKNICSYERNSDKPEVKSCLKVGVEKDRFLFELNGDNIPLSLAVISLAVIVILIIITQPLVLTYIVKIVSLIYL